MLKPLKHKLRIVNQLSLSDWLVLLEAWWLLPVFTLLLRFASYGRLSTVAQKRFTGKTHTIAETNTAQHLGWLVSLSSRLHVFHFTCLVRAITLSWMLGQRGIQSRVSIGANKSIGAIGAHAWVEVHGQAIGEPEDIAQRFAALTVADHK